MIPKGEQWDEIAGAIGGDLAVTSYAVLLAAMARARRTCSVRLVRKPVTKEIFLVEGRPVGCRSNLAHETFGRFLLSEGRLSPEDHPGALAESLRREIPLGEVLIERELLTPQEVYRNLQKNLARKLLDGFTWERGRFEVAEDGGAEQDAVRINVPQLVLTGVSKLTPRPEIETALARLRGEKWRLEPSGHFEDAPLRLTGRVERVVQALALEPLAVEELSEIVSLDAGEVDRIVYALALIGRAAPASEVARKRLSRPSGAPAEKQVARGAAGSPDAARDQDLLLRQSKIVEAFLSFRRKDAFDFLGLEETCTVPEIDAAYLSAAETFAPWSLAAIGAADFAEQADVLFKKAAQAYAELKNTESRGALVYRRKVLRDERAARKKAQFSIETDLLDSEEQFKQGLALAERGDLGKALGLLEFAVDCDPQNALYRAELAYRREQFEPQRFRKGALEELAEAIRIDPACGPAHYYLGLVLARSGDLDAAEAPLRKSIKLMAPDRRPIDALRRLSAQKKR